MLNSKSMTNKFNKFITVVKKYSRLRIKNNDTLDRYLKPPYKNQSKIGYNCLIQNVILIELMI